jgi:surfactin synthase thioesterase subunit
LPYAGGGASAYRHWLTDLSGGDHVDFIAVQLPGRETRHQECSHTSMAVAVSELERVVKPVADVPLVLFGYSMGAVLAYELAFRLAQAGLTPHRLMVAARTPPYRVKARSADVPLSSAELVARVRRLGGTAPDVIESELFDQHFLPTLHADFTLVDSFSRPFPQVLPCDLLALGARDDPEVTVDDVRAWGAAAGGRFELELFDGGHFFLHTAHERVMACVNARLPRSEEE